MLLLDEPTGALDQEATSRVEDVLRTRLARGTTILMARLAAARVVLQLIAIGFVLRTVFRLSSPSVTLAVPLALAAVAAREVAALRRVRRQA